MDDAIEGITGPSIGEPAPQFSAAVGDSSISLKDFKGSWIIIFTRPDDILPLFKTRTLNHILCKRRTKVLALVRERMTDVISGGNFLKRYVLKHRLTVLGDPDGQIEALYGLKDDDADGGGVKAAFVIDQKGMLRAKFLLPQEAERDLYEIIRVVDALQAADRHKDGRPETLSWKKRLRIAVRPKAAEQSTS